MRSPDLKRVLILVPGALGERLSGPEIRAVRLGQALATAGFRVTLMPPEPCPGGEYEGLAVVPFSRLRLLREARRHDVLIASTVPPFALALKRTLGIFTVSDQYDPVEIELGTLAEGADRARSTARAARRLQLRCADLVLCAGRRQRELLEAEVDSIGESKVPIVIVPFGIDADPGPASGHPLREHFQDQIRPQDRVVLWWGSLWRWLDAETAIRAVASIAGSRPDLKLVFTAGRPPNGDAERHSALAEAKALATELDVIDRSVLFLEEWVPYDRRADYLRDADIGLTLHRHTEEASLAARARYMDYLWSGLPCVLGRGDETAERFEESGFATLVETGSIKATATAIVELLDEPRRGEAAAAGRRLAGELRWQQAAAPLLESLRGAGVGASSDPSVGSRQLGRTTSYYARRVVDRLLPSH